ncbi:MAG: methylated-DNA--[protein]-cysteine S-methyltransferase [Gammaproteobacteria bacterium]|nr:methylated-DNA--[protein]-cysteine S-methyltransferase [Gammaproteobacteria bacterium]
MNIDACIDPVPLRDASARCGVPVLEAAVAGVRPSVAALLVARVATPFGGCLVASADGALCFLEFVANDDRPAMTRLKSIWPGVQLVPVTGPVPPLGPLLGGASPAEPVRLHLRGTPFRLRVWDALLAIPAGTRVTYGDLAARIGAPRAARAVAGAVAANHLAVLVPCHRVVRADGDPGGYRWGRPLKLALLAAEQAALHPTVTHNAAIQHPGG